MLGGIVQHIAQHLLQPLRVAGDGLIEHLPGVYILQVNAILMEQLTVCIDGILHLGLQVHLLHPQGKAAVLDLRELQQLLHHIGKPAGFTEDDPHAPAQLLGVAAVISQQGLAPAVDSRQRGAQLMGHGGNKLRLHLFTLADLLGHLVDIVHQLPHLVVKPVGDLDTVAAAGNALGRLRHLCHRQGNLAHEGQIHHQHHAADHHCDAHNDQGQQQHLLIQRAGSRDQTHNAHHAAIKLQGGRHRQNVLSGEGILAGICFHPAAVQGTADLRSLRCQADDLAAAGDVDAAAFVQKLQLNGIRRFKIVGKAHGAAVILGVTDHDIGVEVAHAGPGLALQGGAGIAVIVGHQDH